MKTDVAVQVPEHFFPHLITGGGGHTFLILRCNTRSHCEQDIVLSCGWNRRGQLGIGRTGEPKINSLQQVHFDPVLSSEIRILSVSCGWDHTLLALENGRIFVCGSNHFGQLGLGHEEIQRDKMTELTFFRQRGLKVVKVAAGLRHSFALTSDGSVYAWGQGKFGQLGLMGSFLSDTCEDEIGKLGIVYKPELSLSRDYSVKDVAAGQRHSLAITNDGIIMITGDNKYGQLGHDRSEIRALHTWRSIDPILKIRWNQIFAGWTHNLAIDNDGNIWGWGRNDFGQLGRTPASHDCQDRPLKWSFPRHPKQVITG
jgi:secretion-regulating guanine nucleotide exchange factor